MEDGSEKELIIRRRVKKEKDEEENLEFEVEVRRVSAGGKSVSGDEDGKVRCFIWVRGKKDQLSGKKRIA